MKHLTPKNLMLCLMGSLIYCIAFNTFIVPAHMYSSGFVGISQLVAGGLASVFHIRMNLQPIVYFCLDVPLFLIGLKILGKASIAFTFLIVLVETLFMNFIPIPDHMVLDNVFAMAVVGGCLEGIGTSITFRGFGSSGGTDLLGMMLTEKYRKLSVGRVNLAVNACVYLVAGMRYSLQTAVYSLVAEAFSSIMIDRYHKQNNLVTVNVISEQYEAFIQFINVKLDRGATVIDAKGAWSGKPCKVVIAVLSEYELGLLEKEAETIDPAAFIFSNPRTSVFGEFEKRLSA